MGFSDEDQILMKNLYVFKGYGAIKLSKEFLNKGWGLRGLNRLFKKLQETGVASR